jgi:hypothetical protein
VETGDDVNDTTFIRVRDWASRFENSRTRELRTLAWLPEPTDLSSDLYSAIVDHPDGAAHFGISSALHKVASKSSPRGDLRREDGRPHDAQSLARVTRIPQSFVEAAISRLLELGDLETVTNKPRKSKGSAWQRVTTPLPDGAGFPPLKGREGNHHQEQKERKEGTESTGTERARDEQLTGEGSTATEVSQASFSSKPGDDDEKPNAKTNPVTVKPTEREPAIEYASPDDELKAIYKAKEGKPITIHLLDQIRTDLEIRGVPMATYVEEVRRHVGNGWNNPAGFLRSKSKSFRSTTAVASAPLSKAEREERDYKCPICGSAERGAGLLPPRDGKILPCECASAEYIARQRERGVIAPEVVQ